MAMGIPPKIFATEIPPRVPVLFRVVICVPVNMKLMTIPPREPELLSVPMVGIDPNSVILIPPVIIPELLSVLIVPLLEMFPEIVPLLINAFIVPAFWIEVLPVIKLVFTKLVIVPELNTPYKEPVIVPLLVKAPNTPPTAFWSAENEPVIAPLFTTELTVLIVTKAFSPFVLFVIVPLLVKVLEVLSTQNSAVSASVTPELITKGPVVQVTFEPSQSTAYGETEEEQAAAIT